MIERMKECIYFNELLRRFIRDREFENYLGILVINTKSVRANSLSTKI